MPDIVGFRVERPPNRYGLDLSWNDAAFVDGTTEFAINVSRVNMGNDEDRHEVSARVSIEPGENEESAAVLKIVVIYQDQEIEWSTPLDLYFSEDEVVAQVIEMVPTMFLGGDPITGCLIRSGLSATIGQLLTCKNHTVDERWLWPRSRAISRCLRNHGPDIAATAIGRALRCTLRAGF